MRAGFCILTKMPQSNSFPSDSVTLAAVRCSVAPTRSVDSRPLPLWGPPVSCCLGLVDGMSMSGPATMRDLVVELNCGSEAERATWLPSRVWSRSGDRWLAPPIVCRRLCGCGVLWISYSSRSAMAVLLSTAPPSVGSEVAPGRRDGAVALEVGNSTGCGLRRSCCSLGMVEAGSTPTANSPPLGSGTTPCLAATTFYHSAFIPPVRCRYCAALTR